VDRRREKGESRNKFYAARARSADIIPSKISLSETPSFAASRYKARYSKTISPEEIKVTVYRELRTDAASEITATFPRGETRASELTPRHFSDPILRKNLRNYDRVSIRARMLEYLGKSNGGKRKRRMERIPRGRSRGSPLPPPKGRKGEAPSTEH
jgi:hypothetical protein